MADRGRNEAHAKVRGWLETVVQPEYNDFPEGLSDKDALLEIMNVVTTKKEDDLFVLDDGRWYALCMFIISCYTCNYVCICIYIYIYKYVYLHMHDI